MDGARARERLLKVGEVAQLGFHLPYGLVTAVAYEAFNDAS